MPHAPCLHGHRPRTLNLHDPDRVLATSPLGPMLSRNGGRNWRQVDGASVIAFVAWTEGMLYGLAPNGTLYASDSSGKQWDRTAALGDHPTALVAAGDVVAAVVGDSVVQSARRSTFRASARWRGNQLASARLSHRVNPNYQPLYGGQ